MVDSIISQKRMVRTTLTRMAMGIRDGEQSPLWVVTADLPKSPGHPFYARLNALLDAEDFDRFVEKKCRRFYATRLRGELSGVSDGPREGVGSGSV